MKKIVWFFLLFLIIFIFFNWFFLHPLSGLDQLFLFKDRIKDFGFLSRAWRTDLGNGLGGNGIGVLWIETYLESGTFLLGNKLGLSWEVCQRILFLWPYLFLSIISPLFFFKKLFPELKSGFVGIGVLVYSFNTYILMLLSGGQMAVGISYALAPLVFSFFADQSKKNYKNSIQTGLLFALLILFDLRIAYVVLLVVSFYFLSFILYRGNIGKIFYLILSVAVALLLHSFWILPGLLGSSLSLPEGLAKTDWLSFLSVANFSNTISLLHPNWPENIFGKVYFMRPEFILIPIIAFGLLLFKQAKTNFSLVFFIGLALLGTFLSKGVNPPAGEIYRFLYNYLPFFTMFRDPTKFYLLIALSYSVLIPYSLFQISQHLTGRLRTALIILFIVFWSVLLSPLLIGRYAGSFSAESVPGEYQNWADFLSRDQTFSRTLWLPKQVRYSYFTDKHPNIRADLFFQSTELSQILANLNRPEMLKKLQDLSIKYIAVPYDMDSEIFLVDRKYDANFRANVIDSLDRITFLNKISDFQDNLNVYLIPGVKDHFYVDNQETKIAERKIDATRYLLTLANVLPGARLVFTESFDPGWKMKTDSGKNYESSNLRGVNSFVLSENGNLSGQIYYEPQRYVFLGSIISVTTLLVGSFLLIFLRR